MKSGSREVKCQKEWKRVWESGRKGKEAKIKKVEIWISMGQVEWRQQHKT